jgi:hypothetical protein
MRSRRNASSVCPVTREIRLARLVQERQAAEAPHQLVGFVRGQGRPGSYAQLVHRVLNGVPGGEDHHRPDP